MADPVDVNHKLRPFHLASGLLIGGFILAHLTNHTAMFWGADMHIAVMDALRPYYRNLAAEALLMIAIAFQLGSGITLIWRRRKESKNLLGKVQLWSGIVLALFIANHVAAVWGGRLALGLDTNYFFAAAGMHAGYAAFFIPYYFLGVSAVFIHAACAIEWRTENRRLTVIVAALGMFTSGAFVAVMASDPAIPLEYLESYP